MTTPEPAQSSAQISPHEGDSVDAGGVPELKATVEMLRELSRQSDPQKLVEIFRHRSANLAGGEYLLSLSRRGLDPPWYRITRHVDWPDSFNPWEHQDELPLFNRGLLGDLIYGNEPRNLTDVSVPPDDPGRKYLRGARSILCLPQYDSGVALNMVLRMSPQPHFFDESTLADTLTMSNLFGRATYGLVLAKELAKANAELEHELKRVGQIQRYLLPTSLPSIEGLEMAASYETATRAGGDYYDLFPLSYGRWGIIIADVSGHGAPAAVVMAIMRTILHNEELDGTSPSEVLQLLNDGLSDHSCCDRGTFVTAFYAVYDPAERSMRYSCAGHVPPIVVDACCQPRELSDAQDLPLAVRGSSEFHEASVSLAGGDTVVLYTDGIIEAANPQGEVFGTKRVLAAVCQESCSAQATVDGINSELGRFAGRAMRQDDQTLLVLRAK
ncbi:MAG: PP2C family protein-serine/threonine phosphatase [Planctomycetota bacterium]